MTQRVWRRSAGSRAQLVLVARARARVHPRPPGAGHRVHAGSQARRG